MSHYVDIANVTDNNEIVENIEDTLQKCNIEYRKEILTDEPIIRINFDEEYSEMVYDILKEFDVNG